MMDNFEKSIDISEFMSKKGPGHDSGKFRKLDEVARDKY